MIMSPSRLLVLLASIYICSGETIVSTTPHPPTKNETTTSPTTQPTTTPTTAPTKAPTTTPAPANPSTFPDNVATWILVNSSNNMTCIKLKGAVQIAFNYTDSISHKSNWVVTNIQENSKENYTVSGSCGDDTQTLSVSWASPLNKTLTNSVSFTFRKMDNKTKISLVELAAKLIVNETSGLKPHELKFENFTEFATPINNSFKCNSKLNFLGQTESSTLWFANLQYEAFGVTNSTEFENPNSCSADSSATGGMSSGLLAFLIIVLIVVVLGGVGLVYYYKKIRANTTNAYENM